MARESESWTVLSRELIADLLDLLEAELAAARGELAKSWRGAGLIGAFFGAAVALAFWVVAVLAYALVAVFMLWLPAWGAGLIVAGIFLVAAALLGLLGWWRVKRLANPIDVVFRRLRDHIDWWRSEVRLHPGDGEGRRPPAGQLERRVP